MKNYVPLHAHSHYSLLDGLSKPAKMADRCSKIGVKSCAITDHGTISGNVQFFQAMKNSGIKPILGCEIYVSRHDSNIKTKENSSLSHFILLAKNKAGWDRLIKIISESNKEENFYHKPRLSFNKLKPLLDGNILGFSGHLGSCLSDAISEDPDNGMKIGIEHIALMKDIFGSDNYFLEAQLMDQNQTPQQKPLTDLIRRLGKVTKTSITS